MMINRRKRRAAAVSTADEVKGPRIHASHRSFLTLAIAMLGLLAATAGMASGEGGGDTNDSGTANAIASEPVRELPAHRTATTRTFELSDGQLETRIFEVPVNYRDEQGDWQPIDEDLAELANGAVVNGANNFDIHLPEDLDEGAAKVTVDGHWVSQAALGIDSAPAELEGGVATYSTSASAEIEFEGLSNGLKETIKLADATAPSTFHFSVSTSAGVAPTLEEDGSIVFRNQDGDLVTEMPAPFMVDAADITAPLGAVRYSIEATGSHSWKLTVEADPQWLQASERNWPVIIDPSVTVPAPSRDCIIATTTTNQMCGTAGYSYLTAKANYPSGAADQFARTLLYFRLDPSPGMGSPPIPKEASLTSATINLHSAKTATNVTRVDLYDVSRSWSNAATWTNADPYNKWTSPGGDFGNVLKAPASVLTAQRGSQAGWWQFSSPELTNLVEGWRPGTSLTNQGVLLKLADETPRVCCFERRVEWESSAGTEKPYLSVQYILPAPAGSRMTSPTDGTKTAKRFRLTSAWEHSGVDGITFQYKREGEYAWSNIPESQVIDGNNQTVAWPHLVKAEDRESRPLYWDASSMTQGWAYKKFQIRAVLSGSPGAVGYTKPTSAEINRHTGGPKDGTAPIGPGAVNLLTGNFTVSRTDVSIPAFNATVDFSRSFSSREAGVEATGVLGPGWKPASPLEQAGGSSWSKLKLQSETESFEGESFTYKWAELSHADGAVLAFEENESGQFLTPPEITGYVLYRNPTTGNIELTDPDGNRTVFSNNGSGNEYLPISVAMTGGPGNKSRMIYEGGRLTKIIAPAAPGISCPDQGSSIVDGCRLIAFTYQSATAWGAPASAGTRLQKITYYASGFGGPWDVAQYSYDTGGRLVAAWDPRVSPALKETYTYNPTGQIATITPPGKEPWTMEYGTLPGGTAVGRLAAVKRPSLVSGAPTAQTTIAYDLPVSGNGAPYQMGAGVIAAWGQKDLPTDATAIFPPDEVPTSPPSSFTRATVYYMDAEGQVSNVANGAAPGSAGPSISTTEMDRFRNVVRELTPQNRLLALAAGSGSVLRSRELDTQYKYSADGIELQEEIGPTHEVRLESGSAVQARRHRTIQYDKDAPITGTGDAQPFLPTTETIGALLASGAVVDKRTTEYRYNWTLRQVTETIADPGGPEETKSVTVFDNVTGLPTQYRQPTDPGGTGAGTTKISYYVAEKNQPGECENDAYAGLPCKVAPVADPGTAGQPQLLVKKYLSYSRDAQPLEVTESPGGGTQNLRKTIVTYDAAGRQKTIEITGGGAAIPKMETVYSATHGMATSKRFVCSFFEPACDTQAATTTYDRLGRVTSYEDADGNVSTTSYDLRGRPVSVTDGKGAQNYRYDSTTGLMVELEDSAAGTFTASYDADGRVVKRGLPNGLTAQTTFNTAGEPVDLAYVKAGNCGTTCNWLSFKVDRSVRGQILAENGTTGSEQFKYDRLGRLISANETPAGGSCTTRTYGYDKNSNRTALTTVPGFAGICASSGGNTKSYTYDAADRLVDENIAYDNFGRLISLPNSYAGGTGALETTYFANDMVATQSQGGVSNSYQIDGMLRHRSRLQGGGGLEGIEIFHYKDQSDSPSWTERGSLWTRNILGIGGALAAIQTSTGGVQLQLTDLHGDIVATASTDPSVSTLLSTSRFDEFGVPKGGPTNRYGWLGANLRPTELSSGVIQMGLRSYVPAMGRFLTVDSVRGGSANAYDYVNQDPLNSFDLGGTKPGDRACDSGIMGCQCVLWVALGGNGKRGRLWMQTVRKCRRTGGITLRGYHTQWWIGTGSGDFEKIPFMRPGANEVSPRCRATDPCQNYQRWAGWLVCKPSYEYQVRIEWTYNYNAGNESSIEQQLVVKAQEFCPE